MPKRREVFGFAGASAIVGGGDWASRFSVSRGRARSQGLSLLVHIDRLPIHMCVSFPSACRPGHRRMRAQAAGARLRTLGRREGVPDRDAGCRCYRALVAVSQGVC